MTPTVEAPTLADPVSQAPRSAGERALDHFLAAGFERTEPPILHPAAIFLDMSGEEVRRRLFLTADAAGEELCLRPEYTIPVCRAYLNSDRAGAIAEYSYLGPVFRARAGQGGEQTQTGLESFGRKDAEAADAEVFALSLEAATAAGGGVLAARVGDAGLFDGVLESLEIPDVWRRRLRRGVARGRGLDAIFNRPSQGALGQAGVLAALESADHAGAKALVEDLLAIAGIETVGGRSAGEIADRFLEQASLRSGEPIRPSSGRCCRLSWRFPAIPTRRRSSFGAWPDPPGSTSPRRLTPSSCATASSPPGGRESRIFASAPPSCATSTITPASCSRRTIP